MSDRFNRTGLLLLVAGAIAGGVMAFVTLALFAG